VKNINRDSFEKAKNYAFLLLKFRLRSEKELFWRLERKKFDAATIKRVLEFLKEKDFINDKDFAKSWSESRLKRVWGLRKIKEELKVKGIAQDTIDNQIAEIKKSYCEKEIVSEIIEKRLKKLKGIEPQKAQRRIYAYLLRRGFSPEVIIEALNRKD
jgi:regulatory protein